MVPIPICVLAFGPAPQAATEVSQPSPEVQRPAPMQEAAPVRLRSAVVRVRDLPPDPFIRALALRTPGLEISGEADGAPVPRPFVFVAVRRADAATGEFAIELIVSDGRAYDRTVAADEDQAARVVASTVAQLVAGIEDGTAQADRSGVPIPEPQPQPQLEPTPPPVAKALRDESSKPELPPRGMELGLTFSLGSLLGMGPPAQFDRFAAWGGGLGLGLQFRSGALVDLGARVTGRGHPGSHGIVRVRVGLGAGYVVHARAFEMPIVGLATIEPWYVTSSGRIVGPTNAAGDSAPRQLLAGAALRFSPGYRIDPGRNTAVRIGLRAELAGSWLADAGGGTATVLVGDGVTLEPAFRVGGVELVTGLDATVWFRLGSRR